MVAVVQTFGDRVNFHPHVHAIASRGGWRKDGTLGPATFQPDEILVLISEGGAHAAQAWVLVRAMGHRNVYSLRGGVNEWLGDVMNPNAPSQEAAALSRYFGGAPRISDVKQPNTATAVRRRGC